MNLVWSRKARDEFQAIGRSSAERWGPQVATRYLEDVLAAARAIAADPRRARLLRGDFRIRRVRSHYLIMQVDGTAQHVVLLRILHVAQDIERHLPSGA